MTLLSVDGTWYEKYCIKTKEYIKINTGCSVDLMSQTAGAGFFNQTTGDKFCVTCYATSSNTELIAINAALVHCLSIPLKSMDLFQLKLRTS